MVLLPILFYDGGTRNDTMSSETAVLEKMWRDAEKFRDRYEQEGDETLTSYWKETAERRRIALEKSKEVKNEFWT